jgi:hypothetical protein
MVLGESHAKHLANQFPLVGFLFAQWFPPQRPKSVFAAIRISDCGREYGQDSRFRKYVFANVPAYLPLI